VINTTELKRGQWIDWQGEPWLVVDVNRQTPSARGAAMIVKARLKHPKTGLVQEHSFRGGDKVSEPNVEQRAVQYLYRDGDGFHFMDLESYDQFSRTEEDLGDQVGFLIDNLEMTALLHDGELLGVELPAHVDLVVSECAPPIKTAGSGSTTKPATLETGRVVQVPPYLEPGERIRVDTRDGRFVQRAK